MLVLAIMSSSKTKRKLNNRRTTSEQTRKGNKRNKTTRENIAKQDRAVVWRQLSNDQDDSSSAARSSCSTDEDSYGNKKGGAVSRIEPPIMVEKGQHPSNVSVYHNEVNVNKTKHACHCQQSAYDVVQSKKRENAVILSGLKKYLCEKWYEFTKFITKDKQTKNYIEDAIQCGYVSARTSEEVTEKEFANKYQIRIYTAMVELRHNSQNLARRNSLSKYLL